MKYDESVIQQFSSSLEKQTGLFIEGLFGFKIVSGNSLFHYTDVPSADLIVKNQTYWASYIRSTSDILEFAYPLSICRDWLCIEQRLFKFENFPFKLFCHFNEQAQDPAARYYFVSLTETPASIHHSSMYGGTALDFKFKEFPSDLNDYVMLLRCKYSDNPEKDLSEYLDQWKSLLDKEFAKLNLDSAHVPLKEWFYMFMRFCHMCSLCIKQNAFSKEKEVRLIFVPKKDEMDADQKYHGMRGLRPLTPPSLIAREYIPLKLTALGITVSISVPR